MSEYYIRICSMDPYKQVEETTLIKAVDYLKQALDFQDINYELHDHVKFIISGSNLTEIRCPFCNEPVNFEDVFERVANDMEIENDDLSYTTSCCGRQTLLSDLIYDFNCGFGRYVIEFDNPNMDHVPQQIIDTLQDILDDRVQLIFCHW